MDPSTRARLRVLVVDDCPDTCAMMRELLKIWGHECRVALDGPAAVDAFADFRPDVVILDIGLPGFDGFEVARRLRRTVDGGSTFVLGLSGYATEAHIRTALEAGCDRFWVKPIDPIDLRRLLEARGQCGVGAN
jgi:CheY-like chemotaxis protein